MKIYNFRGDLADSSAKKEALVLSTGNSPQDIYLGFSEVACLKKRTSDKIYNSGQDVKTYTLVAEESYV